jgi:hypothetical protein
MTVTSSSGGLPSLIPKLDGKGLPSLAGMAQPMMALANTTEDILTGARERTQRLLDQARAGTLLTTAAATNAAILRRETDALMQAVSQQRAALLEQLQSIAGLQVPGSTLMGRVDELARTFSMPNLLTLLGGGALSAKGVKTVGVAATARDAQRVLAGAAAAARGATAGGGGAAPAAPGAAVRGEVGVNARTGATSQHWELNLPTIDDGSLQMDTPNADVSLSGGLLPRIQAEGPMPGLGISASGSILGGTGRTMANPLGLPMTNLQAIPSGTSSTKQIDTGDSDFDVSDLLDADIEPDGGPFPLPQQPVGGNLLSAAIPQMPGTQTPVRPQATPAGA